MADVPFAESLCHRCAAPPKYVRTARSTFLRCPLLPEKYPRQPVLQCTLFRPAVLTTERLVLRELTPADEPFVASMTDSVADAADWMRRSFERYARDGFSLWLAIDRQSGEPVGQIGLLAQTVEGVVEPEVAYHLHARARRRGYAREGAAAVRDWAFARGYDHVIALVREDNVASQAVARSLGMAPGDPATHHGVEHVVWRVDRR
ncbi:MAG TPA: GNAT family N-acetyltransferase [Polyangia bacterium]|nr:GNAT family N-acetyltransferase [Polyangia bacterium]